MIKDKLNRLFRLEVGEKVTYEKLESAKSGMWSSILDDKEEVDSNKLTEGVWYKKYHTKSHNQLIFITRLFKGYGYHYHSHDCKETVTTMSGSVMVNDNQLVDKDDTITFFANTLHKVYYHDSDNGKYLDLFVEFSKV